jgi:hypothetical protein
MRSDSIGKWMGRLAAGAVQGSQQPDYLFQGKHPGRGSAFQCGYCHEWGLGIIGLLHAGCALCQPAFCATGWADGMTA